MLRRVLCVTEVGVQPAQYKARLRGDRVSKRNDRADVRYAGTVMADIEFDVGIELRARSFTCACELRYCARIVYAYAEPRVGITRCQVGQLRTSCGRPPLRC